MSDLLSLASRRRIYEHVEQHSGSHLREIGRKCGVPLGTALYHLDRLEAEGLLSVRRDGRYKRYFPAQGLGRKEKDLLSAYRHDVPRRIALALLERPAMTQRELCAALDVSRSTLSFHVNDLIRRGVLRRDLGHRENRYALEDPALSFEILERFGDSLVGVPPAPEAPMPAIPLEA
jgi:predicted transcriptional regulator